MRKSKCFLFSLSLAGFAAAAAAQQSPPSGPAEGLFPMLGRVLSEDQRHSLRQIMESQRSQIEPLQQKIQASRHALLQQITSGKFDESAVRQYARQSAGAQAELTLIFAKALSQLQPPLSPRQIEQLQNFQPARFRQFPGDGGSAPESRFKLPPPLPRDTNDLPVVK